MAAVSVMPDRLSEGVETTSVREITHWVGGAPVRGASGRFGDVFHPSSGRGAGACAVGYGG